MPTSELRVKPFGRILLVEDAEADALLVKLAFKQLADDFHIHHIDNGEEALRYLSDPANRPDMVLLDLGLPRVSGFDVLEQMQRATGHWGHMLPVVILTSSSAAEDCRKAYSLGAWGYLPKPPRVAEYRRLVEVFCAYWFRFSELPHG